MYDYSVGKLCTMRVELGLGVSGISLEKGEEEGAKRNERSELRETVRMTQRVYYNSKCV